MKKLQSFLSDERGLETVEYAVIGGLLVVALVLTIGFLSDAVIVKFEELTAAVES